MFEQYDRITDTLLYLSDSITLNFTVSLSRKDRTGGRAFFHYETQYQSKYIGSDNAKAIKRYMNFFYTIDDKNDFGNSFILRPQDIAVLIMLFDNQLLPMYFGTKRIFKVIDDQLAIIGEYTPVVYTQSEYKYLMFEPIVIKYENGSYKEGLRFTLNNKSNYIDIDIDRFLGFYHLLKNTDMYAVACSMVHYTKTAPYDVNVFKRQGLGGGTPLPDWNYDDNTNKGNFFDTLGKKG